MDAPSLPLATELEVPIGGRVKERPEDFVVDEIPAYTPSGAGEHLFVRFEKVGLDTEQTIRRIAEALAVDPRASGWAGLKDRHAVTTQWASFHRGDPARARALEVPGVRILEAAMHENKLRTGHLEGNRFTLRLRGADPARASDAERVLGELARSGVPAFFGEQRFGRGGSTLSRARAWIVDGGRGPRAPFERKLLVSALQSSIFNVICAERMRTIGLAGILDGDLVRKEESGGLFVATELDEVRGRAARFEVSATGPMFGAEMRWPEREAKAMEEAALQAAGLDQAKLASFRRAGEGTRRRLRFWLRDVRVSADVDGLVLAFTLPAGAYATIVLRELTRDAAT
jgi:tRNA pseudouridine13 synthase